jgi:hypothetical protein
MDEPNRRVRPRVEVENRAHALMVSAERALARAGVEEQAQQVGDGRRTVANEQLA